MSTIPDNIGIVPVGGMISTTHRTDTHAVGHTNLQLGTPKIVEKFADFKNIPSERLMVGTLGIVTNDGENNGVYEQTPTGWVKFEGGGTYSPIQWDKRIS